MIPKWPVVVQREGDSLILIWKVETRGFTYQMKIRSAGINTLQYRVNSVYEALLYNGRGLDPQQNPVCECQVGIASVRTVY